MNFSVSISAANLSTGEMGNYQHVNEVKLHPHYDVSYACLAQYSFQSSLAIITGH
jgi:hypothetical protein